MNVRNESRNRIKSPVYSVNFHLWKPCNAKCTFCFATFRDVDRAISLEEQKGIVDALVKAGCSKINFAGGEPTLYRHLPELVRYAKAAGLTTSIVTNGFGLERLLREAGDALDICALSVDAGDATIQQAIGRGDERYIAHSVRLADQCRTAEVMVKLNTVVCRLNLADRMHDVVRAIAPERWKVFQVLGVDGQNDGDVEELLVTSDEFNSWVDAHRDLVHEGFPMVVEDNDAMTDSYVMIDPSGCFYGNTDGQDRRSRPILEAGVFEALRESGFEFERLEGRGGVYDWARATSSDGGAE
jgi:radical S-adenosyl methionine domain-containing protein 2